MQKNIAIILAGGKGERFGNPTPKQFIKLAGKSIIEYTIKAFESHDLIDSIIIVSREGYVDKIWEIAQNNDIKKIDKVITGGESRFDSTLAAINALHDQDDTTKILLHDAVRPLIDEETITKTLQALDSYNAVDTAIDATDTIIEVDENAHITNIPDRNYMKRGQTPQGFRLGTLKKAYSLAISQNKKNFTCDCGVVKNILPNEKIYVVKSNEKNLKITRKIDLFIAEKYIQMGADLIFKETSLRNLKGKKIVVFGSSSGIGKEIMEIAKEYGAQVFGASRKNGVDITNKNQVFDFLQSIDGDIDIVINTAAILIRKPFELTSYKEIHEIININYIGAINVSYAAKRFLDKTGGMLIHFTSSSYTRGRANYALYSSTKAAIVNLTQALSEEWDNIKVNCINPERTKTPMREKNFGKEPPNTLLSAKAVAQKTLQIALTDYSGMIVDIKNS